MVDTQSYLRKTRVGPGSVVVRQSFPSYQLLNSEYAHRVFHSEHPESHSCRTFAQKQKSDPQHWQTFLLTFGLKHTHQNIMDLHCKQIKHKNILDKPKDKRLYAVGQRGSKEGFFNYPRGLGVASDGSLLVADTENHRVQVFNAAGVVKSIIGKGKGSGPGELKFPTGVCWMPTGNYGVADQGNVRVQIFRPKGTLRMMFVTSQPPHSITCDYKHNVIVSTIARTIEVYKKGGKLFCSFPIGGKTEFHHVTLTTQDDKTIYINDSPTKRVRVYDYNGQPIKTFEPEASQPGLAVQPVGISMNLDGDFIMGDALNHTVNLYNGNDGKLLEQLVCPTDDLGSVQTVVITPEGHIATTEFTSNGVHCLKIFRYFPCACHRTKRPSSKVGTITPIPAVHYMTKEIVSP